MNRNEHTGTPERGDLPSVREGSALYYSLLRCDSQQRSTIYALLRVYQTLNDALVEVQEPAVAEQKIHWWHEEIDRLFEQQSRHPDCQRLQNTEGFRRLRECGNTRTRLLEIVAANNNEKFLNAADEDSFRQRMLSDYGNRIAIVLEVLGTTEPPLAYQEHISLGLGLFDRLRQSHRLYHRGYPIWPDSLYLEHDLAPDQLLKNSTREQSVALFNSISNRACQHLEQAITIATSDKAGCRGAILLTINASLRKKQLTLWCNKSINPLEKYVTLTPLNKAWLSWRCRSTCG